MHVTDAIALQGEFSKAKGWTDRKIEVLMNQFAAFLSQQDKKRFHAFISVLDINAREKLVGTGAQIPKPEVICSETCTGCVLLWATSRCPTDTRTEVHTMDFFFDRGEKFKYPFERACREGKKSKNGIWHLVNTVAEAEMKLTPGIQAADMLLWADRMEYGKRFPSAHQIFKSVIPCDRIEINEEWLRKKYPLQ